MQFEMVERYRREHMKEFSLDDVYKAAEKSRATIYTIVPGFRLIDLSLNEQLEQGKRARQQSMYAALNGLSPKSRATMIARWEESLNSYTDEDIKSGVEWDLKVQEALARVAEITGGWTSFLERPEQASEIYPRIFADINRRYVVGYYPTQ
jgi:hypothetical protein